MSCPQISVGDIGYFVDPPDAKKSLVFPNPLDNGTYGVDFVRNLGDPNIAFGTVHLCAIPIVVAPSATR